MTVSQPILDIDVLRQSIGPPARGLSQAGRARAAAVQPPARACGVGARLRTRKVRISRTGSAVQRLYLIVNGELLGIAIAGPEQRIKSALREHAALLLEVSEELQDVAD